MVTLRWYALYTKPHKEHHVSTLLKSKGYEVYLPTVEVRRRGRQKVLPFFSCYLFARLKASRDLSSVRWTPGLRSVVSFGGQPAVVPETLVFSIKEHLTRENESGYELLGFKPGHRVRIASGPFRDLEAIFEERLSSRDRARILVDFLDRWQRCEIDIDCLKRI